MKTFSDFNIDIKGRKAGHIKTRCPQCNERRSDKRDPSLSVDIDKGLWHCHYCEWSGSLHVGKRAGVVEVKNYRRPEDTPIAPLSEWAMDFFVNRGISENTIRKAKISSGLHFIHGAGKEVPTVQFRYYLDGELINVKYRSEDKKFGMEQGAELIPYNLDAIKGKPTCIITEGEMDCLSLVEIGYDNCVSVPNGASSNLSYLDDFLKGWFDDKQEIYIAVDADTKGLELRQELIKKFGEERCKIVTYADDSKDANEQLTKHGRESLAECIANAKDIPVSGIFSLPDYEEGLDEIFRFGLQKGLEVGHPNLDALITFETKRVAVVTGIPGCLSGDTRVTLADGSHTTMEHIKVGDIVQSVDAQWNLVSAPVSYKWDSGVKEVFELTLSNGNSVKATKDHKFLTFEGWKRLSEMNENDFVLSGQWIRVKSIVPKGEEHTYDIEVLGTHNFMTACITSNSGKSEFIDEMCVRLNVRYHMKAAFFSPENMPLEYHAVKLIEKLSGKRLKNDPHNGECISERELAACKEYCAKNFFHILPTEAYTIDAILAKAKYLVRKHGVKMLVIDPFNRIESEQNMRETETQYISRVLDRLTNFAQQQDVLIFLMAHPTKIKKDKDHSGIPTLYDISGSANFYNKADFGIIVHRERDPSQQYTLVRIEKVKFRHLGAPGDAFFKFNAVNGRYIPINPSETSFADFRNDTQPLISLNPTIQSMSRQVTIPFQDDKPFPVPTNETIYPF